MHLPDFLTISIASKDRPEVVEDTLRKIHAFGLGDCPLILCDDGSEPALDPLALGQFPLAKLLRNEQAQGQAKARNRIAQECTTPFLLQLDDDSYPVDGSLKELLELAGASEDCLAIAVALEEPSRKRHVPASGVVDHPADVCAFVGCAVLLSVGRFRELGGYADWIGRTVEEEELCMRALHRGLKVVWSDRLRIRHDVTPVERVSDGICYRSFRNWAASWSLHAPRMIVPWRLFRLLGAAVIGLMRERRTTALRGFFSGLRLAGALRLRPSRLSWADYRRFRQLPHALDFFVRLGISE